MSNAQHATISDMEDLIGTLEATRILNVDKSTISRWVKEGKLVPAMKMPRSNGAYLFKLSDIEALKK